jgi:hypothetical protein
MNRTRVRMTTMIKRAMLTLVAILVGAPLAAQTTGQPPQTNEDMFRELDLGAPNAIRTGGGEPGPGYWQNRADYTIHATLDTVGTASAVRRRSTT